MAREFIIREKEDWGAMVKLAYPTVGVKPFRVILMRGLKRTVDQNALLHAVFAQCASTPLWDDKKEAYYHKDTKWWKAELMNKLGKKSVHFDLDEQPTVMVVSTTEYNTKEMSDLCEKIKVYMDQTYSKEIILPESKNNKQ